MTHPPKEALELLSKHSKELRVLAKGSGKKLVTIEDATFLLDALSCEAQYNLTQPEWAKEMSIEDREEIMDMHMRLFTWTESMKKAKAGPLITEIVDEMLETSKHRNPRNIFVYAGHDLTLSTVTRALGLNQQLPRIMQLASALVFELRLIDDLPMVKVSGW